MSEGREPGKEVGYKEAFIIGLSQALAVLPGLSRSGTTISTGLMLGVRKSSMAQFSFLMVLVPILGEAFLQLVGGDFSAEASGISTLSLLLGTLTAFVSGYIATYRAEGPSALLLHILLRGSGFLFYIRDSSECLGPILSPMCIWVRLSVTGKPWSRDL